MNGSSKQKVQKGVRRQRKTQSIPRPQKSIVQTQTRSASNSSALGSLVGTAAEFAKKIPVIGNVVDKVDTVASSILSFLGIGSSLFESHYLQSGRHAARPHSRLSFHESKEGRLLESSGVVAGDLLLRYELSIGPEGSRSRVMGQLYEKVKFNGFQLMVNANCAASTSGSIAYVFVPDPNDRTLDFFSNSERLSAVCARESVQFAQIWQSTLLSFRLPAREFFVSLADNVERLTSPGAVYVIAMTGLDPTSLPTLRQTSALSFTKATSAPMLDQVEGAFLTVAGIKPGETGNFTTAITGYSDSFKGNFSPTRILSTSYLSTDATGSESLTQTLLVKKGEYVSVYLPNVLPSQLIQGHVNEAVWLPSNGQNNKPGDPYQWNAMQDTTPPWAGPTPVTEDSTYGYRIQSLIAAEDSEIAFYGDYAVYPTDAIGTIGQVFVIIDKTGTSYTDMIPISEALSRVVRSGEVTRFLSKSHLSIARPLKLRLKADERSDNPVIVPRASSVQPAVSLRR